MRLTFSFPQQSHLRKKSHFEYVYSSAKRIENRILRVFYAPSLNVSSSVAFIASKRTGGSVQRNQCRRRLKEIYRLNRHRFSGRYDMVWSAKQAMCERTYSEIEQAILSLWEQLEARG